MSVHNTRPVLAVYNIRLKCLSTTAARCSLSVASLSNVCPQHTPGASCLQHPTQMSVYNTWPVLAVNSIPLKGLSTNTRPVLAILQHPSQRSVYDTWPVLAILQHPYQRSVYEHATGSSYSTASLSKVCLRTPDRFYLFYSIPLKGLSTTQDRC